MREAHFSSLGFCSSSSCEVIRLLLGLAVLAFLTGCAVPELRALSEEDRGIADAARQEALETMPSGQGISWRSVGGYITGDVTPIRTYRNDFTLEWCREYEEVFVLTQGVVRQRKAACRADSGHWVPANI